MSGRTPTPGRAARCHDRHVRARPADPSPDDLRGLVAAARRRLGVPALGAAVVRRGGVALAVDGVRARGGAEHVRVADPWHIGSCAKALTAATVARLVASGRLAWCTRLPEALPALHSMHPGWDGVTIDDLLRHRSGLPADMPPAALRAATDDRRPLTAQRLVVAERALRAAPRGRGRFRYSNLGYVVTGAVMEAATGRAWELLLIEELLVPLGVASAGFGPPGGAAPRGHPPRLTRLGLGHGAALAPGERRADNPPVLGPAGRLHLSLGDWARVAREFLAPGPALLRPGDVDHLLTPAPGPGPAYAAGWIRPGPLRAGHPLRRAAWAHQGSNRSWAATIAIDRDRSRAALVVTNDGRRRALTGGAILAGRLLGA
jgi:D-alanyl-D-alanine carboxypeptidase